MVAGAESQSPRNPPRKLGVVERFGPADPQVIWENPVHAGDATGEGRQEGQHDDDDQDDAFRKHKDQEGLGLEGEEGFEEGDEEEEGDGDDKEENEVEDNPCEFHVVQSHKGLHNVCACDDHVEERTCTDPARIPNCRQCKRPLTEDGYMIGAKPLCPDACMEERATHVIRQHDKEAILLAARRLLQEDNPLPLRTFGIPLLHSASGVVTTAHSFCGVPCMRRYSAVHQTFNSSEVNGLITDMGVRAGLSLDQLEAAPDEGLLQHQGGPLTFDEYGRVAAQQTMRVLDAAVFERRPAVYQTTQCGAPREVVSRYRLFLRARQHQEEQTKQKNLQHMQQQQQQHDHIVREPTEPVDMEADLSVEADAPLGVLGNVRGSGVLEVGIDVCGSHS